MAHRTTLKLFAVVALAACETAAPPGKPPAKRPPAPAAIAPRTVPSGRPACGNVMTKAPPRDCDPERK